MCKDGVAGSTSIYKHRGKPPPTAHGSQRRVSIRFVMDISGSMYTFNRLDGRMTRSAAGTRSLVFRSCLLNGHGSRPEYGRVARDGALLHAGP